VYLSGSGEFRTQKPTGNDKQIFIIILSYETTVITLIRGRYTDKSQLMHRWSLCFVEFLQLLEMTDRFYPKKAAQK
jgi:hypothetical protein